MTEVSSAIESANLGSEKLPNNSKPKVRLAVEKAGWLNSVVERFGDYCSSILVKETRQAVKSKQFIWSYVVLLLAVGVWTMFGLAVSSYSEAGRVLLVGFWFILGFPLGIIIPFSAYRSLAREFEDGTIQLISITTMKPSQVVIGKFGSSILQMVTYLSVLAPCILFTYMLRGIDIETIMLGIGICLGGSICLTILGLFLAGAFRSRTLGVGVSVLFVLGLGFAYFGWCVLATQLTWYSSGLDWDVPENTVAYFGISAFFGSTAALLLVAAASQISFPSDNRSTPVRVMMVVQQAMFFAFVIVLLPVVIGFSLDEALVVMLFVTGHYWLIMGFLMSGEAGDMSRRVQRTLPTSLFSKSAFALFMPGAGRGYLFAVANVWACGLGLLLIGLLGGYLVDSDVLQNVMNRRGVRTGLGGMPSIDWPFVFAILVHCLFVTWFLSVNFLLMKRTLGARAKEWTAGTGPLLSLLCGVILVAIVSIATLVVHFSFFKDLRMQASPVLVANWYYSTMEIGFGVSFAGVLGFFLLFAILMLIIIACALVVASRELLHRRIEVPERVAIEELKGKESLLPVGESIDEIFGELKPRRS